MSAEGLTWVLTRSPLQGTALIVHLMLGDLSNTEHDGDLWMRQDALARWARTSRGTVSRLLAKMVDDGFLEVVSTTSFGTTRYRLILDDAKYPARYGARAERALGLTPPTARVSKSRTAIPPPPPMPLAPVVHENRAREPVPPCAEIAHATCAKIAQRRVSKSRTEETKGTIKVEEPISPPVKPGKGSRSTGRRYTDAAEVLARAEWERREIKPAIGYVGFRAGIDAALAAGHSSEAVARVLPEMSNFSPNAFDFVLGTARIGRRGLRSVPLPISADRDAPEGLVQT